jgi:hypothetical protein
MGFNEYILLLKQKESFIHQIGITFSDDLIKGIYQVNREMN